MDSAQIVTIIVAVIAATGASLITALSTRPKISAEAKAANAGSQVSISADARAWAETFQKRADQADAKASAAELKAEEADERADQAEKSARECQRRMNTLESRLNDAVDYMFRLQAQIRHLDGTPEPPPSSLRPPL